MIKFSKLSEAFKEVPTHLKSGNPNNNPPAHKPGDKVWVKNPASKNAKGKPGIVVSVDKDTTKVAHPDGYSMNFPHHYITKHVVECDDMGYANKSIELDENNPPAAHELRSGRVDPVKKHSCSVTVSKDGKEETRKFSTSHSHGKELTARRAIDFYKNKGYKFHNLVHESFYTDGEENEVTKEHKKVYDAQTKSFNKDRVQNAAEKKSPIMKVSESEDAFKGVTPGTGKVAARNDHKLGKTSTNPINKKYHKDQHADWDVDYTKESDRLKKKTKNESLSFKQFIDESSPFDWKNTKSEIDWKSDDKTSDKGGVHKGTYGSEEHKAKGDGSVAPKRGRGRPAGSYQGEYKKRDPAGKAASAQKTMASKADGFVARDEYKQYMHDAIKKRQLQLAGITK
jgi:hypothetical protein